MGRKTLESLPKGKPFSNRINIVLTKDANYTCDGATIVHNLDELYQAITEYPTDDVFIIGGGQIYNLLYPHCRFGYITRIDEDFEADTFLDPIDSLPNWEMVWKSDWQENKGHKFVWTKYKNTEVII
jgi:dihydrofolate reductase